MKILLFRDLPAATIDLLQCQYPEHTISQATNVQKLGDYLPDAEIIFGNVPPPLLSQAKALRWLQIVSSGFDEYRNMEAHGCILTTAHGLHAAALAEHVLFGMLLFARNHPLFSVQQRNRVWDRKVHTPFILSGQTVGLIGYGEIGREVARRCRAFGMIINAVKLSPAVSSPPELDSLGGAEHLDRLLATADHIVLGLPLTAQTRNFLDERRISLMKPGACLYNVARGGLVDESALLGRLQDRTLRGALLDVFAQEPLPADSPFWQLENCIVTPHVAGHYDQLPSALYRLFQDNLARFLTNRPLRNVASFSRGY
jgi:phosphoglycerate dehydrogenase-like enzyme